LISAAVAVSTRATEGEASDRREHKMRGIGGPIFT
jgi:hypothetical protein